LSPPADVKRVLPGNAAKSYLFQRVTGAASISGGRMPLGRATVSRLQAGLHFPYDLDAGAQIGRSLSQLASQHDQTSTN
jgi:hypothetical protein